jgi:hypothetical protein
VTDQATRVVPAGWYEDPASSAHVRWWNGLAWTEHTTLKPTQTPGPQPMTPSYGDCGDGFGNRRYGDGFATDEQVSTSTGSTQTPETLARIAEARELERQYGISTAEHDIIMRAAADDTRSSQPVADGYRAWNAEPEPEYEEPGTLTASVWFIAAWPLLTLAAAAAAVYLAYYVAPTPAISGIPVVAGVVVIPTLLALIWAIADARKLRSLGHRPASPALALLGPLIYLIGRRARVAGSGPLITLIVLTLLVAALPVAGVLTGASTTVTKGLEIQQAVYTEYVDSGRLLSVACEPFIGDYSVGSYVTCSGVMPDGSEKLVYVSFDTEDGRFSTALAVRS